MAGCAKRAETQPVEPSSRRKRSQRPSPSMTSPGANPITENCCPPWTDVSLVARADVPARTFRLLAEISTRGFSATPARPQGAGAENGIADCPLATAGISARPSTARDAMSLEENIVLPVLGDQSFDPRQNLLKSLPDASDLLGSQQFAQFNIQLSLRKGAQCFYLCTVETR